MNLANKISIIRIFLIPVFIILIKIDYQFVAGIVFIVACATDALDGYIARSRNQITNFGKLIDPLADKLLVITALLLFLESGVVPLWTVIVILSREFIVTGLRTIAVSEGVVIAASIWGKYKTVFQMVAIILILFNNFPFRYISFPFDMIVYNIAVVATIYSGIDYIVKNRKILNMK